MLNIKPKTYNEALRLSRCLSLRQYARSLTDEMIENMYNFISEDVSNKIGLSEGIIYFVDANGETKSSFAIETNQGIGNVVLGAEFFRLKNQVSSDTSGCGGCSSNNNNNNNNNNNG